MPHISEIISNIRKEEPFHPYQNPGYLTFRTEEGFSKYIKESNLSEELARSWVGCNIAPSTHEKGYNYDSDLWLVNQKPNDGKKGYLFAVDPLVIRGIQTRTRGFTIGNPNWPKHYSSIQPFLLPFTADNEVLQNLIGDQVDEVLIVAPDPETYSDLISSAYSFIKPGTGKLTMIIDSQGISYIDDNWSDPLACIEEWRRLCVSQGSQPNFQVNGIDLSELQKPEDIRYLNLDEYFKKDYPESLHIPRQCKHFPDPKVLVLEISKD